MANEQMLEDFSPGRQIVVTDQMVEAGLAELRAHHYDTDIGYMLESVYRAMAYASADASETKVSR